MRNRRPATWLIVGALLGVALPGCQACYSYRPLPVLVRDIETGQPIPGAEVRLSYPLADRSFGPWEAVGTTGADGIVRLRAAPYGDMGMLAEVRSSDHMDEQKNIPPATINALEPARFNEDVEKRPPQVIVEMYAHPNPTVELVLPTGYRGMVKVQLVIQDDAPCPPGQRNFPCEVPPSGIAQLTGPFLLHRVFPPDFCARFADGSPVEREPKGEAVGLWSLKFEEQTFQFFVGTRQEYERLHIPVLTRPSRERSSPGGNAEEAQGRHRRRSAPSSN